MQSGHDVAMQYRELLQMVMHNLNRPGSSDAKTNLGNVSRKIAQCVTELATAAEGLKDDEWVDPSDPTFIAENELLGAAKSIENAAKKLASLKPRREIKGKVMMTTLFLCLLVSSLLVLHLCSLLLSTVIVSRLLTTAAAPPSPPPAISVRYV